MYDYIVKKLKNLINFNISDDEQILPHERIKRMDSFRRELSVEKYSDLFNLINVYLLNEEMVDKDKCEIVGLLL